MTLRNAFSALTLLWLLALGACSTGVVTPQTTSTTPTGTTPKASSQELTYIGSDGNVWEMGWPQGTPKQLTNDAQAGQIRYSGLSWSPDGSKLAVLRDTGPQDFPTNDTLALLSPTGQSLGNYALTSHPYAIPLAWSPDSSLIAYRTTTDRSDPNTGDIIGRLTILNASDGSTKQTLLYDDGGGGCGGAGFPPLLLSVWAAHYAYQGIDTFSWVPGQKGLLVSSGCGDNAAGLVDLGTGNTTAGYPENASYQPGGNLTILGQWTTDTAAVLGLTDASGAHQKTLVSDSSNGAGVVTTIGAATWSPDGKTIYFERDNGIWRVGADGSNALQIVQGAADDSQHQATVQVLPSASPDGSLLLYQQLKGDDNDFGTGSVTSQCYVAQPDGSNATALPQGASSAVWRPTK